MPYPNINALSQISADQKTVTLAGPLHDWLDEDIQPATVFAFVTQRPLDTRNPPTAIGDPEPTLTATGRGSREFGRDNLHWALDVPSISDQAFEAGWAFATAVAVNFTKHGQLQTYTWSRWVFLTEDEVTLESP